jgi:5'-deoxynucleotidase YfbR-like HD superfamily hydrolase
MELNIREMLCGDPVRLRYVNRYSTCRVNHKETVAEHSYFVGLYAFLIGTWCTRQGQKIMWSMLMGKAMVHDAEEARTGDWPRHFKHSDDALAENLDRVAELATKQLIAKLTNTFLTSGDSTPHMFVSLWKNAKSEGIEGDIVAFADFLSVLSYVSQEHLSGNRFVMEHVQQLDLYFKGFESERFDLIRPLVDQAGDLLRDLFADCRGSVVAAVAG